MRARRGCLVKFSYVVNLARKPETPANVNVNFQHFIPTTAWPVFTSDRFGFTFLTHNRRHVYFSSCFLYHHVLSFSCQRPLKKARGQRQTSVPSSSTYCSVHNKILPLCLSVRSFPFPCFLSVCHSCFLLPSGGSHGGQRADAVPSRRTAAFLASDVF